VNLSQLFIQRPIMTVLVCFAIVLFGAVAFRTLPVAALPSVDYPTIEVSASLPGASPETMASTVATPLEREFSTIAGIQQMSSTNSQGSTDITVQFTLDRSIDAAADDERTAVINDRRRDVAARFDEEFVARRFGIYACRAGRHRCRRHSAPPETESVTENSQVSITRSN